MLLSHVYRISLEDPNRWSMWFGLPANESSVDAFRADFVASYIAGLIGAAHDIDPKSDDLSAFLVWLRDDRREFPARGWCAHYLDKCEGNHFLAVGMLFNHMYDYIACEMPDWFVELNRSRLPSQIVSGLGVARHEDIRDPKHIVLCLSRNSG